MPSPNNPNPLSLWDFILYPLAIGVICFGLTVIGNLLGALFGGPIE